MGSSIKDSWPLVVETLNNLAMVLAKPVMKIIAKEEMSENWSVELISSEDRDMLSTAMESLFSSPVFIDDTGFDAMVNAFLNHSKKRFGTLTDISTIAVSCTCSFIFDET